MNTPEIHQKLSKVGSKWGNIPMPEEDLGLFYGEVGVRRCECITEHRAPSTKGLWILGKHGLLGLVHVQGHLAHKKRPPRRTLQYHHL